eukprot:9499069-Pyramimonas_sp.AAC.1
MHQSPDPDTSFHHAGQQDLAAYWKQLAHHGAASRLRRGRGTLDSLLALAQPSRTNRKVPLKNGGIA